MFAQGFDGEVSGFCTLTRRKHDVFTFGEEMSWKEPRRSAQESGGGEETPA